MVEVRVKLFHVVGRLKRLNVTIPSLAMAFD